LASIRAQSRGGILQHNVSIVVSLFLIWMSWSGEYTLNSPMILGLGIASCLLVMLLARRMRVDDTEGHPMHILGHALLYAPWLAWAILKANIDVSRRILSPSLPISPTVIQVPASQRSVLGQVIYANSITLTPGTVTVDVEEGIITVHALSREAAEDLAAGKMDRRVASLEGRIGPPTQGDGG
jgi:multicomponent Na+:H+ antiporter subunit E